MDLYNQHPLHKAKQREWLECQDFYRAGRHVLEPGRAVGQGSFAPPGVADVDSVDSERSRSRSRFIALPLESYIHSHPREALESYNDRVARATHYPLFRSVVDLYVSATLKTPPARFVEGQPVDNVWLTYWADADRSGTPIDGMIRDALTWALTYGIQFAVTDKPRFGDQASTRQQQLDRGERAYTYLVSPLDVLDWRIDPTTGRFDWVTIREDAPDIRKPGQEADKQDSWVRLWGKEGWILYSPQKQSGGSRWRVEDSGLHPCGEPPVSVLFARRGQQRNTLDADSMLAGLARGDRAAFNYRSLLDEVLYGQAFSMLWVPDDDGGAPGPIDYGIGIANSDNAANGQPILLAPEASLIVGIWKILNEHIATLRQTYGAGRGRAEHSKEERSAAALTVESRDENNRVASLAECCEEFDRSIHRHVAAWEGRSEFPQAEYSRDVSLRSLGSQLNDAMSLKALGVPWESMVELIKPLLAEHMKEQGRSKESIDRAVNALEKSEETVAPNESSAAADGVSP